MNEPGARRRPQELRHDTTDRGDGSARGPDVDENVQAGRAAQPGERLSRRQVMVVVLIALLVAGAVVAHLPTGPGVSH